MCGISGIYSLNGFPIQYEEISAQIETMIHRGPDQGAVFISAGKRCGLGIRRLSIIDVAGGDQPLCNEDQSIHLVYNGETYNHAALRTELEAQGHRLKTGNDGEVVVHGYEAWGAEGMLHRLRGMGAFALWDEGQQQLLLARDRFGIKPLYYAKHGERIYFASEIKGILAHPDFPRQVNLEALDAMLTVGFVPGQETAYQGIFRLPPAHYLVARDGQFSIKPYWQLTYSDENATLSLDDAADQFLSLLRESVQLRLMSEVPLGALLSGGIDSAAIVALSQANLDRPLKTVSIGFTDAAYNEDEYAKAMAEHAGTDHQVISFDGNSFDDYLQVLEHLQEPQGWATAMPIYQLYQACRQSGLTVVLTGEGADELLGGYHWHMGDQMVRPLLELPQLIRQVTAQLPGPLSAPARRVLIRGAADIGLRYQHWLEVAEFAQRRSILSADVLQSVTYANSGQNSLLAHWSSSVAQAPADTAFDKLLWLQTRTRLVDYVNFQVDRMSMAHSIEARVPFLDHKLWEFCATLPTNYKLRFPIEKRILRHATKDILPEATRLRPKKGLAAPYSRWLQAARLPDWAEDALSESAIKRAGLFDVDVVQDMRKQHQANSQADIRFSKNAPLLMAILNTQLWHARFIDGA